MALIGVTFLIFSKNLKLPTKLILMLIPTIFFIAVSKSDIGCQRYILPIIPFFAIYSAVGAFYLYHLLNRIIHPNLAFFLILIFTISQLTNITDSIKHNLILSRKDTREDLIEVINHINFGQHNFNIYSGGYLGYSVLRKTKLPIDEHIVAPHDRTGIRMMKAFEKMQDLGKSIDIMFFDSFSQDPFLYEPQELKIKKIAKNYEDLAVIQLNPFKFAKSEVPFSRESIFSPSLPDLLYRNKPGPFIEIYIRDNQIAKAILDSCHQLKIDCEYLNGKNGYYLNQINQRIQERMPISTNIP